MKKQTKRLYDEKERISGYRDKLRFGEKSDIKTAKLIL